MDPKFKVGDRVWWAYAQKPVSFYLTSYQRLVRNPRMIGTIVSIGERDGNNRLYSVDFPEVGISKFHEDQLDYQIIFTPAERFKNYYIIV
jgi:hypothetical protein